LSPVVLQDDGLVGVGVGLYVQVAVVPAGAVLPDVGVCPGRGARALHVEHQADALRAVCQLVRHVTDVRLPPSTALFAMELEGRPQPVLDPRAGRALRHRVAVDPLRREGRQQLFEEDVAEGTEHTQARQQHQAVARVLGALAHSFSEVIFPHMC